MRRLGAVVFIASFVTSVAWHTAHGHSWYDRECCSDSDCRMVSSDTIGHGPTGYILPNGEVVQYGTERTSLDGEYHWCQWGDGKTIRPAGKAVCLYVPPGGV